MKLHNVDIGDYGEWIGPVLMGRALGIDMRSMVKYTTEKFQQWFHSNLSGRQVVRLELVNESGTILRGIEYKKGRASELPEGDPLRSEPTTIHECLPFVGERLDSYPHAWDVRQWAVEYHEFLVEVDESIPPESLTMLDEWRLPEWVTFTDLLGTHHVVVYRNGPQVREWP